MYTQCPDCSVAFRVTADVLKQAAGKVRCGGCGMAFNALEHLSETKPAARAKSQADPQLPELAPGTPGELEADTPPESISAEQSAALLKTLDELAGSDIRIEDTGIEWRVLDADEPDPEPAEEQEEEPELIADTGSLKFFIKDDEPAAEGVIEQMRFDDDTPLPDDFDLDTPTPAAEPPPVLEAEPVDHIEEAPVDLELGNPDEWEDLLGEMAEPAAEIEADEDEDAAEVSLEGVVLLSDAVGSEPDEDAVDAPLDMDTQFALQAAEMGIDLSGSHETVDEEANDADAGDETSIDDDLIAAAFENEAAAKAEEEEAPEAEDDEVTEAEEAEEFMADEEPEDLDIEEDEVPEEPTAAEFVFDEPTDDEPAEEEIEEEGAYSDASLVEELDDIVEIKLSDGVVDAITEDNPEFEIPEMTEEEKTINMMIDQDLLAIAVEDEDGFASTIVQIQPDKKVEEEIEGNKEVEVEEEKEETAEAEDSAARPQLFETIVMEGEFVRAHHDAERNEKNRRLGDAMIARRAEDERKKREAGNQTTIGMVAALVGLGLLLVLQVLHQSREALATMPAFNDAIGPVYRMLGRPVTPAWDVAAWTVEATTGDFEESENVLTIFSRVANKSDKAIPYPLVHVSLTDRFEEIVGSRVLEPAQYLASDLDPRNPVAAGNTFNAIIAIESPSPEATGYKISVCYRLTGGQLRCAIEDFK